VRFLYLIKRPLVRRDYDRLGVGYFLSEGHQVSVLDLSEVIHPNLSMAETDAPPHSNLIIHKVRNWKELRSLKPEIANSDLALLLIQSYGLARSNLPVLRLLAETKTPYLVQAPMVYPGWRLNTASQNFGQRLKDIWRRAGAADPLNSIIARMPRALMGIPTASFVVYSSAKSKCTNSLVGPATHEIEAHTYDYDLYRQHWRGRRTEEKNQAVFIDQNLPFHEDYTELNASPLDADEYFGQLRALFTRIEEELGLNVVIASHPRADYADKPHLFGNRPVRAGKTFDLIAQSRLVLAHNSTAIGHAVMFRKPVMLLVTRKLYHRQVYEKHIYEEYSRQLGTPLRYFDDLSDFDLTGVFDVNTAKYERYMDTYLRYPHSKQEPLWQVVLDAVKDLNPFVVEAKDAQWNT